MQIGEWIKHRDTPGTIAEVARRAVARKTRYRDVEKALRCFYILEAVMSNGGNQKKAALEIGVTKHTIYRAARSMGLSVKDIRRMASRIGENDASPSA